MEALTKGHTGKITANAGWPKGITVAVACVNFN
jgi:hypothetical protein